MGVGNSLSVASSISLAKEQSNPLQGICPLAINNNNHNNNHWLSKPTFWIGQKWCRRQYRALLQEMISPCPLRTEHAQPQLSRSLISHYAYAVCSHLQQPSVTFSHIQHSSTRLNRAYSFLKTGEVDVSDEEDENYLVNCLRHAPFSPGNFNLKLGAIEGDYDIGIAREEWRWILFCVEEDFAMKRKLRTEKW